MINQTVARRYAEALVEVASGSNLLDEVEEQLRTVVATVEEDEKLAILLVDPKIVPDKKKTILEELFGQQVNPYLLNTLKILVDKKRTGYLKNILDQYVQTANNVRGIAVAHVTSAQSLDEEACAELSKQLSELTGKKIKLAITVDPTLLGGAQVRIGDTVIDGSITSKLSGLEKVLGHLQFGVDNGDTD